MHPTICNHMYICDVRATVFHMFGRAARRGETKSSHGQSCAIDLSTKFMCFGVCVCVCCRISFVCRLIYKFFGKRD